MDVSPWYQITDLEVGTERYADGQWRLESDEIETRICVQSNGESFTDWVTPGLEIDAYQFIAEKILTDLYAL